MILRETAKKFYGLNPEAVREYHKSHISKTMGIAVLAVGFVDSLESGGRSIKIDFKRYHSSKVRQRNIVGKNGIIIQKKGDSHYIYFNVTDSNNGTSKDPKFQLKIFFETCLFPVIEKLVCGGSHFEGFAPVIQGDNASPHQDENFYKYVVNLYEGNYGCGNLR